jgi:hypothetical protein
MIRYIKYTCTARQRNFINSLNRPPENLKIQFLYLSVSLRVIYAAGGRGVRGVVSRNAFIALFIFIFGT